MAIDHIPINLYRIRNSKKLKQSEVAEKSAISRQAFSAIEKGRSKPNSNTLIKLAKALGVSLVDLIADPPEIKSLRFRSNKALKKSEKHVREQMIYEIHKWLKDYNFLEEILNKKALFSLNEIDLTSKAEAAYNVRHSLKLDEDEPIHDILGLLENVGIKFYLTKSKLANFFGLSIGKEDGGPAITVNTLKEISIERQIFTVAHELGHLILHKDSFGYDSALEIPEEENESNRFASHFLLPQKGFDKEWSKNKGLHWIDSILHIKRIFKVSYLTILRRLIDTGITDNNIYKDFSIEYKRRYGKNLKNHREPNPIVAYEPECLIGADFIEDRLSRLVREAYETSNITLSRGAEILNMSLQEMRELSGSWLSLRDG